MEKIGIMTEVLTEGVLKMHWNGGQASRGDILCRVGLGARNEGLARSEWRYVMNGGKTTVVTKWVRSSTPRHDYSGAQ